MHLGLSEYFEACCVAVADAFKVCAAIYTDMQQVIGFGTEVSILVNNTGGNKNHVFTVRTKAGFVGT